MRVLPKPDKHPAIFVAYTRLPVGESFVVVNNHGPKHLREEFDADYAGSYGWEYLEKGREVQRMLGHAKASMTLDVYADLFDEDLDSVAANLDAAIRSAAAPLRPASQ